MNQLEWSDEHLLGIPAVDLQHRRIFDCFVSIAREAPIERDRWHADPSFVRLDNLLEEHFALEESMMRSFGYPGLERHIEEHRQFHAELLGLAQQPAGTNNGVSREAIRVCQKWQREHIMKSDRRYVEYFSDPAHSSSGRQPVA